MKTLPARRRALMTMGLGMVAGATGFAALHDGVASAGEPSLLPPGAKSLEDLTARLSRAPRRRDFKTVPMILNDPTQWDHAALSAVIAYRGAPKQVWDNTGIVRASRFSHPLGYARHRAAGAVRSGDVGEIAACEADWRQVPEQHTAVGAEACRRRPERLREPRRRIFAGRQLHPGAAAARRGLPRLSQRDMGVGRDADRHRGEP